ncbi:hypothetical protein RZR97_00830 [Hydrogenimonas thermophila]|uniref:hypothetical protein n=1 Tax=Hydrogenimonas thermophila TaxID=223786 RepID=UPI00293729E3|nr:hypothetical protein [Hydrogenimonas thermophila]WOE70140.1 hypothetical protein RZR91_00830 [Hydrogenimonas thermophila]WOE72657.1 hypothetical protein RZR97_00830 [Hydrogenimonas thermophila]
MIKQESAKIKREARHAAAELIASMRNINNAEDIMHNYDDVTFLLKEELEKVIIKLGYCMHKDVEFALKLSIEHTYATLQKKNLQATQKFFNYDTDVKKAIRFLFQRLIANVRNTHDRRYKKSLFFECEQYEATEYLCMHDERHAIEQEIELEKIINLPKNKRIKAVKKAWEDARYDLEFNGDDLHHICRLADVSVLEVLNDEVEAELKAEKTKLGHQQLFFVA